MAHEVWKRLEDSNEGTSTVKESKLYIFNDKYAKLKMLKDESVSEMFHRFNDIVNELRNSIWGTRLMMKTSPTGS